MAEVCCVRIELRVLLGIDDLEFGLGCGAVGPNGRQYSKTFGSHFVVHISEPDKCVICLSSRSHYANHRESMLGGRQFEVSLLK